MHNSGAMDVPHHVDSMTDSSESSDDDQMLFDIMESHDDSFNKVLCLCSMFVMNCFDKDEALYEHKWGGSPHGRKRRLNVIFKVPSRNWKSNISVEKIQHIWRNSLTGDSVYQE